MLLTPSLAGDMTMGVGVLPRDARKHGDAGHNEHQVGHGLHVEHQAALRRARPPHCDRPRTWPTCHMPHMRGSTATQPRGLPRQRAGCGAMGVLTSVLPSSASIEGADVGLYKYMSSAAKRDDIVSPAPSPFALSICHPVQRFRRGCLRTLHLPPRATILGSSCVPLFRS